MSSYDALETFCKQAYKSLKPDAKFIGMNSYYFENGNLERFIKYGIKYTLLGRSESETSDSPIQDFSKIRIEMQNNGASFSVDTFYISKATFEKAFS